ncbi:hypothetical protein ACSDQ9_05785 [Aestuariimicrobium soli]|uniref:hypothetical protein n=1 Tax=Aestuariimicrobium soli TaxID=2035834 RepID=UPI003EB8FD6D
MAERRMLQLAPDAAWTALRKSPAVDAAVLNMAVRVRDAANAWAESQPRSGKNKVQRPHFEVFEEPGKRRARYTVRPATGYATWLVMQKPAEFMACLDAARG